MRVPLRFLRKRRVDEFLAEATYTTFQLVVTKSVETGTDPLMRHGIHFDWLFSLLK